MHATMIMHTLTLCYGMAAAAPSQKMPDAAGFTNKRQQKTHRMQNGMQQSLAADSGSGLA
jgi:hypothetical protein